MHELVSPDGKSSLDQSQIDSYIAETAPDFKDKRIHHSAVERVFVELYGNTPVWSEYERVLGRLNNYFSNGGHERTAKIIALTHHLARGGGVGKENGHELRRLRYHGRFALRAALEQYNQFDLFQSIVGKLTESDSAESVWESSEYLRAIPNEEEASLLHSIGTLSDILQSNNGIRLAGASLPHLPYIIEHLSHIQDIDLDIIQKYGLSEKLSRANLRLGMRRIVKGNDVDYSFIPTIAEGVLADHIRRGEFFPPQESTYSLPQQVQKAFELVYSFSENAESEAYADRLSLFFKLIYCLHHLKPSHTIQLLLKGKHTNMAQGELRRFFTTDTRWYDTFATIQQLESLEDVENFFGKMSDTSALAPGKGDLVKFRDACSAGRRMSQNLVLYGQNLPQISWETISGNIRSLTRRYITKLTECFSLNQTLTPDSLWMHSYPETEKVTQARAALPQIFEHFRMRGHVFANEAVWATFELLLAGYSPTQILKLPHVAQHFKDVEPEIVERSVITFLQGIQDSSSLRLMKELLIAVANERGYVLENLPVGKRVRKYQTVTDFQFSHFMKMFTHQIQLLHQDDRRFLSVHEKFKVLPADVVIVYPHTDFAPDAYREMLEGSSIPGSYAHAAAPQETSIEGTVSVEVHVGAAEAVEVLSQPRDLGVATQMDEPFIDEIGAYGDDQAADSNRSIEDELDRCNELFDQESLEGIIGEFLVRLKRFNISPSLEDDFKIQVLNVCLEELRAAVGEKGIESIRGKLKNQLATREEVLTQLTVFLSQFYKS